MACSFSISGRKKTQVKRLRRLASLGGKLEIYYI